MITGTITPSDYLDAQRLHRAWFVRWYGVASAVVMLLGVGIYIFSGRSVGLIITAGCIGGLLGEWVMSAVYLPWKVRRLHAQQKDFASPFTYTWNSSVLEAQSVNGQSKREWGNYAKYMEDERMFLLYQADNLFEMLPKRWFQGPAQIQAFRELASRAGKS